MDLQQYLESLGDLAMASSMEQNIAFRQKRHKELASELDRIIENKADLAEMGFPREKFLSSLLYRLNQNDEGFQHTDVLVLGMYARAENKLLRRSAEQIASKDELERAYRIAHTIAHICVDLIKPYYVVTGSMPLPASPTCH